MEEEGEEEREARKTDDKRVCGQGKWKAEGIKMGDGGKGEGRREEDERQMR